MDASRPRNAVSLLSLVIVLSSLFSVPARAQIKLYTFNAYHTQDQMVYAPTASLMLSAGISSASGWTVSSMQIVVDDVPYTVQNPSTAGMIYWNSSTASNPSEHTLYALAQISNGTQTLSLDSRNPPPPPSGPYSGSYGDGRVSDFVIADVQLKSLKFNSNIPLNQDAVTPVPTPEFVWNQHPLYPAAYVQGKNVNFTMTLCNSAGAALTGSATLGYALNLQASPNTTNPATGQPDPALTLFDNTMGNPVAPVALTGGTATVSATTALSSWVAKYAASFSPLTFYAEFTHVTPVPTWKQVATINLSNTLYAVVATPTAPMATPWVPVLDYACSWAARTSDATSATASSTTGFYYAGHYNGGTGGFVDSMSDTGETFHMKSFLSTSPALSGQCNDFADFLVCVSNALGARDLQSQRSTTVAHINDGSAGFQTNAITDAPLGPPNIGSPTSFLFHQWTNVGTIYDGAIRFGGLTAAVNMTGPALGTTYYSDLVNTSQPNYYWTPVTSLPTPAN